MEPSPASRSRRHRSGLRAPHRAGFTVLEVLIATGLLSIGFSAIFALLTHANNSHRSAVDRTHAATLAASVFDDISLRYWSHWLDRNGDGSPDAIDNPADAFRQGYPSLGGYQYRVRIMPSEYNPRPELGNQPPREIFVTVSVTWSNRGEATSQVFHRLIFIKPQTVG
jgi:type II secretory pathway pseudopilin PulG